MPCGQEDEIASVTERRILDASRHIAGPDKVPGSAAGPRSGDKKALIPMENYGLRCMSTGFLVPYETP